MNNKNLYLFPTMLDEYQQQLTKFLEQERYEDAKQLLRFLLTCTGDERQYAMEWGHLLQWLEQSFPNHDHVEEDDDQLEAEFRRAALSDYGSVQASEASEKLMHVLQEDSNIEQLLLALDRSIYIDEPSLNGQIINWLQQSSLHPIIQYRALLTLKKRQAVGPITLSRLDETIELNIEDTPLSMNEFPENVKDVLEKVIQEVEVEDVTLTQLVEQLWLESMQLLYGTHYYRLLEEGQAELVNCYAAALHHTLIIMVYSEIREDEIRDLYHITDDLRLRYEQVSRVIRDLAIIIQEGF